jgi:hypothetical protein
MSLYREPGRGSQRKWILAALAAVALVAAGFGIGRATAPDPSLESQIADARADATPAADALELVALHYGTESGATRDAAQEQLNRAESLFADVEPKLTLIDREGTKAARDSITALATLVAAGAAIERVEEAATEAEQAVRAIGG